MGFFSNFFKSSKKPNPLATWGQYGPAATKKYIDKSRLYAGRERKRTRDLLQKSFIAQRGGLTRAYRAQRSALTTGFANQLNQARQGVERSAASRGLGKSTAALALRPTMDIKMQRQSALAGLRGQYHERQGALRSQYLGHLSDIKEVPQHYYQYMQMKNIHNALEPWNLYTMPYKGKNRFGSLVGGIAGGFFGGPMGAMAGSNIGGTL